MREYEIPIASSRRPKVQYMLTCCTGGRSSHFTIARTAPLIPGVRSGSGLRHEGHHATGSTDRIDRPDDYEWFTAFGGHRLEHRYCGL